MTAKEFKLGNNQVVKITNGMVGVVVSFNGKPSHIVFTSFTNPVGKWDDELNHKSQAYSIEEVYDGSTLENPCDAFKKRTDLTALPLLFKR